MTRIVTVTLILAAGALAALATAWLSPWWLLAAVPLTLLGLLGGWDLAQRRHAVLRNYPVLGHARFLLERLRPELQQYFIERNFDGRPFDRDVRSTGVTRRVRATCGSSARPGGLRRR